jgi:hypothetical protein
MGNMAQGEGGGAGLRWSYINIHMMSVCIIPLTLV